MGTGTESRLAIRLGEATQLKLGAEVRIRICGRRTRVAKMVPCNLMARHRRLAAACRSAPLSDRLPFVELTSSRARALACSAFSCFVVVSA